MSNAEAYEAIRALLADYVLAIREKTYSNASDLIDDLVDDLQKLQAKIEVD